MAATTAKTAAVPAQADYGIDAPGRVRDMFTRGAVVFLLGFGLWFMNRDGNPRGGAALFAALGVIGVALLAAGGFMVWSSRKGKLAMRDTILDAIPWRGDEKVLDVGCGRGLMLIAAARRINSGKVTGVDVWDQSGISAEGTVANARAEGVNDRVRVENGDARRLSYQAASFDVVVSSLAIHNLPDRADRAKALDEMLRVTKPGGHVAIWDVSHSGEYLEHMKKAGAEVVRQSELSLLFCLPSRWFVVRK